MPYISAGDRVELDRAAARIFELVASDSVEFSCGNLNYIITKLLLAYLSRAEVGLRYRSINEVIGVLECCKQEFYRRLAAPYEDKKRKENGDVYGKPRSPSVVGRHSRPRQVWG